MESLPLEIVGEVAQYLSPQDLAACCAVSPQWRYMFDSNEVWKSRCDPQLEDHLKTLPCLVEPVFSIPPEEMELTSQWRMAFLRQKHLWQNLEQGNWQETQIPLQGSLERIFVSNDCLACFYSDHIELWNVRDMPPVKQRSFVFHPKVTGNSCWVQFHEKLSLIIIAELNFVTVANLVNSNISVKYWFVFNEDLKLPNTMFKVQSPCDRGSPLYAYKMDSISRDLCTTKCTLAGTRFFGYMKNEKNAIHIWDIVNGIKLKAEACPLSDDGLLRVELKNSASSDDILLILRTIKIDFVGSETLDVHYFIYDTKQLNFLPFKKQTSSVFELVRCKTDGALVNDYVAISFFDCTLQIFNYRTSQKLYTFNAVSNLDIIDDGFLLLSEKKFLVVFPNNHVIKNVVDYDNVVNLVSVGKELAAIEFCESTKLITEVWRVSRKFSIKTSVFTDFMLINQACTRMLDYSYTRIDRSRMIGIVQILYFW